MTTFARDLPFGATLIAPDRTRFRLWAPGRRQVAVEVEGQPAVGMVLDGEGWFTAEAACGAGARYRYRFPDGLTVPDPASRAQGHDVHDPSIVVASYTRQAAERMFGPPRFFATASADQPKLA